MWVYDLKTLDFLDMNCAAVEKWGCTHEEFLKITIKDIRPAEDAALMLDHAAKIRSELLRSCEWRHKMKSGRMIEAAITSHRLERNGYKVALVIARDTTDDKRAAEEALLAQSIS